MLIDLLRRSAEAHGAERAVVMGDTELSYRELFDLTTQLASGLHASGIRSSDRVTILLRNGLEFVASFFAVTGLGATAVLLDPNSRTYELAHAHSDCTPQAIITDRAGLARWNQAIENTSTAGLTLTVERGASENGFWELVEVRSTAAEVVWDVDEDRVATYQYSSGSTGRSKRIGRTHAQWTFEAQALAAAAGHGVDDAVLFAVPLFHAYGCGYLVTAIGAGATIVIQEYVQPFTLHRLETLELAEKWRATVLPAAPYMFDLLARVSSGNQGFSSLRYCASSGVSLEKTTFDAFHARFGIPIRQEYGSTEAGKIAVNADPEPRPTWSSVGRALPGIDLFVLDDDGNELPPHATGRVAIRSPGLTTDHPYARTEDAPFVGDLFLTGDIGYLDDERRLTVIGRTKLFIDILGEKVDPTEVEEVLAQHPSVRESAVVALAGDRPGQAILKAAVVLGSRCEKRDLIRFCKERLASFKVPSIIEFCDELPRNPIGKVLRKELLS